MKQNHTPARKLFTTSVLLALLALVSVTAATAAWMTIADRTRVRSMRMDITTGVNLRFDLDEHESFDDYVKLLTFDQIAERILAEKEFNPKEKPLTPVTTKDCVKFVLEDRGKTRVLHGIYPALYGNAGHDCPPDQCQQRFRRRRDTGVFQDCRCSRGHAHQLHGGRDKRLRPRNGRQVRAQ